jgi:tRNA pseudouridine55 synthase
MIQKLNEGYIVNINKPAGWTSFDVVRKVRNITRIKRVGHAGTLDPFATGVLLICIGRATKKVQELMDLPKEYEGILELGQTTDTLDPTGTFIDQKPIPVLEEEQIDTVFEQFLGTIKQKIPAYSAAKIGGRRSYALARKGITLPERYKIVKIYSLKLLNFSMNRIHFRVECSRGTYIRSLGYDIANKLGTTGYLTELIRKGIGNYRLEQSLSLSEFEQQWKTDEAYGNH